MTEPKKKEPTPMEKHIQTILLSIITAGILFGSNQLFGLSLSVEGVKVKLENISEQTQKFVTMDEVNNRAKVRDQEIGGLEKRVTRLENKLEKSKL